MSLRIKDFTIRVSFSSVALIALVVLSGVNSGYLLCFISVIFHELGHLAALLLCGGSISGISLTAFNVTIIEKQRYYLSLGRDLICTFAGPFANLVLCVLTFGLFREFAIINLCICVFNLLPASSLDGGQALYLMLCRRFDNLKSALIVDIITVVTSSLLFFFGIIILLNNKFNFSLLFISLYLFLTVFLKKDKYL